MAITLADFTKIWASTSPLTPYSFSESNYKEGWNFIGSTPPARQMWDSIQNQNDEKLKYIVDNFLPLNGGTMTGAIVLADGGNPLSTAGGTMTGAISFDATGEIGYRATTHTEPTSPCKQLIVSSTNINHWGDEGGAKLSLHTYDDTQTNTKEDGAFSLVATDGTNGKELKGNPNGSLTWGGENVLTSSFITTIAVTVTGSVSANDWADYEGTITYPTGYSHALSLRDFSLPSPANQYLVNWTVSDTTVKIRLYSKVAYTNQSFNVAIAITK